MNGKINAAHKDFNGRLSSSAILIDDSAPCSPVGGTGSDNCAFEGIESENRRRFLTELYKVGQSMTRGLQDYGSYTARPVIIDDALLLCVTSSSVFAGPSAEVAAP